MPIDRSPPPTLHYDGSRPAPENRGFSHGRMSLLFTLTFPLAAVIPCMLIPWLLVVVGAGLSAVLETRGRSACGWISLSVFVLAVARVAWVVITGR